MARIKDSLPYSTLYYTRIAKFGIFKRKIRDFYTDDARSGDEIGTTTVMPHPLP